jgi:hypothetical protein
LTHGGQQASRLDADRGGMVNHVTELVNGLDVNAEKSCA